MNQAALWSTRNGSSPALSSRITLMKSNERWASVGARSRSHRENNMRQVSSVSQTQHSSQSIFLHGPRGMKSLWVGESKRLKQVRMSSCWAIRCINWSCSSRSSWPTTPIHSEVSSTNSRNHSCRRTQSSSVDRAQMTTHLSPWVTFHLKIRLHTPRILSRKWSVQW